MERSSMLNEYVEDNEKAKKSFTEADEYLEGLRFRLNGTKTIAEVIIEAGKFIEKYNVNDEIKEGIIKICDSFDENTDVIKARTELEEYLEEYLDDKEKDFKKTDDTVKEIKEEVVEDANRKLKEVGVELVDIDAETIDKIETTKDVERIKENVENAHDYLTERNDKLSSEDIPKVEVSLDTIKEVVDSPKDNIILNATLEGQNAMLSTNPNLITAREDGSLEMRLDSNDNNAMNFTAMMTAALVASDRNLDMKLIKEQPDATQFRVLYGNFPVTNRPENRLDDLMVAKIQEEANAYNPSIDYMEQLERTSPELQTALEIVDNDIMGQEGSFQMAVNNTDEKHDLMFAMDQSYDHVYDAFTNSGATTKQTIEGNSVATIKDEEPGEQLFILTAAKEELKAGKQMSNQATLSENYQYVKRMEAPEANPNPASNQSNGQAANVTYTVLSLVAIAELLFAVTYFLIFMFK